MLGVFGGALLYALPDEVYAYHARKVANPFAIGLMLGPGRPWSDVAADDRQDLFDRVRIFMDPYGVEPRHATSLDDARANGGYVGHGEIQSNKRDPGPDFPWVQFIETLAS